MEGYRSSELYVNFTNSAAFGSTGWNFIEGNRSNSKMSKDYPTFDEKFSIAILEEGVRALLLGGVACNIYGSTRVSEDTDWWLDSTIGTDEWVRVLIKLCKRTGEACDVIRLNGLKKIADHPKDTTDPQFVSKIKEVIVEDGVIRLQQNKGKADLFFAPNNLEDFETAWKRSEPWDGALRVLCVKDLILTKQGTGRKRDTEDIAFLNSVKKPTSS